ncbi:unnamed protein product [Caenorhabditis auriculariae]|uniref:BPTI/Kunitz inhibitor domain-containing protein n=1 Tax=Caenorhabditis auriculariae TaxID=2777116 RepID=A0A8S1GSM9_9PELO|nr:unnamed protein product [Caenorhabditis auriculariae]
MLIFAVAAILSLGTAHECLDRLCVECRHYVKHGDVCDSYGTLPMVFCSPETNLIHESSTNFLECVNTKWILRECVSGTFYQAGRGCVDPTVQPFMQGFSVSGSGRVGDVCQYNTDCLGGMYCSTGLCTCLSTYILRESYCYEKVNPNQPGCTYDVQCEAVWPGAKCRMDSSIGTCRCPEETHVARETRDGWVCVSLKDIGSGGSAPLYFVCPLPEGAGFKIALNDPTPLMGGFPVGCTVGSSATIEPVQGLHGGGACMWPSDGEYIGDIYDCVHTSPHINLATQFPQSQYNPTADGVCCPSRGTCQQFMWDATASEAKFHSPNNFKTIQHCESYCRDTCQRGSPQYSSEAQVHSERPITSCAASVSCGSDFQCTAIGSQHLCCPTPGSVCSARGGRPFDVQPRNSVFHPGFLVNTGKESIRFFYDPSAGRCQDFVYKGAGGNYNNFLSKHECEMYCARLQCERGSPLRIGEESQRCQNNAQCPSSHECKADQGVCCPRKQTICAQPLRIGDCTENVKRYWYNAKTRQCQMFEYTGCQGNDNNFDTILDCQNFCKNAIPEPKCIQGQAYKDVFGNFVTCSNGMGCPANYECYYDGSQWGCCPAKAFTCSLNPDAGVQCGAGSTFKYFYNSQTQNCESFQFNGCDGNSNNFANRDACEQFCSVGGCPNGGTPQRDHSGMVMVCGTQQTCPDSHECVPVLVGASMINRCCPTRAYMCGLPPQQGTQCGTNFVTRYYFNIVTGQCTSFQFGGCDGNQNNFLTIQQCRNFCMSNSCPAGNVAYVDPNSQMPINCNEALSNSCPTGYTCTFNALINNHVCCGATDLGVCPDGEKAFIDTIDMSPRECLINIEASCPANYLCRFNMQKNKYYCCSSVGGKTCPVGKFLFKDLRTQQPIRCTIGRNDQCPDSYTCQSYLPQAFQGFCCTANPVCPDDAEYLLDDQSQQPRACTMGTFVSCPNGYVCRSATSNTEGFCCKTGTTALPPSVTDGCPPGNYVYLVGGEIAQCDPFNPPNAPCPGGFTCQWSTSNQRYQCCGSNPAPPPQRINDGCPNAQVAFRDLDTVRVCSAGATNCPPGYFCQFSTMNNQFQCCGVSGGCPDESVAFVGMSGEPEKCVVVACGNDEVSIDGKCHEQVGPGKPCLASEQCTGGSICQENLCECVLPTKLVGGFCQEEIECSEHQVLHNGLCHNKVRLGEPCLTIAQCQEGAGCVDGMCECKKGLVEKAGKCISPQVAAKPAQPKVITSTITSQNKLATASCSKPGWKPLRDAETQRAVHCSPIGKGCPAGHECQINSRRTQYFCCTSGGGGTATEKANAKKGAVCPYGRIPYLLNGSPLKCTAARCPKGYECTYRNQDYHCCSSIDGDSQLGSTTAVSGLAGGQKATPSPLMDQCHRGKPLIYPTTKKRQFCANLDIAAVPLAVNPCEGFMVLVSRIVDGRIEKRCALTIKQSPRGHTSTPDFLLGTPSVFSCSSSMAGKQQWLLLTSFLALRCAGLHDHRRQERQTGSGRVGDACAFNTDCLTGMFCNSGLCSCLTTYIAAESYCYQKIDPGQPGCVYNEQCASVWPDAFCDTSAGVGTCRCGENKVERATRDGHVCLDVLDANHNTLAITCPLPEGAGYTSALSDPAHPRQNDGPGPVLCNTDSILTQQADNILGDGNAACLFPSDGSFIADLYDCVEFVSAMDLSTSGYSDKANGICCPNRAFTCVQPTATGPNPTEPRWWYNSITGMCQQFLWDPTASGPGEHSPNNFRTPVPEEHRNMSTGRIFWKKHRSPDAPNRQLVPIISSANRLEVLSGAAPPLLRFADILEDALLIHRFIIEEPFSIRESRNREPPRRPDSTTIPTVEKCSPFTYMGAGGNFNNFLSRIDCELYCARLQCDRGNPLRIGDVTQSCGTNNDCPSSHECKMDQAVCCPRMQTICTQPLRIGNCDRSVRRYWYSAATRECQSFEYTGCQGNDNNFETLVDCQTFCRNAAPEPRCLQGQAYKDSSGKFMSCSTNRQSTSCPANFECYFDGNMHGCCPTKAYTCSLSPSPGKTCGPGISFKYYYNPQNQECESFEYLGCDGNSNNFASRAECETFCGVGGCANGGSPLRDSSGSLQSCSEKDGGCPSTHECNAVSLGTDITSYRCCPTKTYICGLPPQQGSSLCSGGLTVVTRYYFNIVTRKCSPFVYNGCDGNPNNFASLNQCNNFCMASACNAGDVVYLNPNTGLPISCNDELQNNCPKNFQCIYDGLTDQSVCCGATDMAVCPESEKAYINAVDMTVRECLINEHNSCPKDYLCRFNPSKNRYFCCGSITKNYCPPGRAPYKDQMSMQPMRCTMHATASGCPDGFECQSDIKDALQGYCCSVSEICPHKEEYYVDESSGMPRSCTIGHFVTCPAGFSCMAQFDGIVGYCCRGQPQMTATDGCPPGEIVYMERNEVVSCDPFNPMNQGCPTTFSCQWSIRTQRYQCCGADALPPPMENDGCPSRQIAFTDPDTKKPKVCTSATHSCPSGYFCQFSTQNKQFQCCGIPSDCPVQMVAFIGITGDPQACSMNGGQICPEGFSCVRGKSGQELCCAGGEVCDASQVSVNGVCMARILIGQACEETTQCVGGSNCLGGICRCPPLTNEVQQQCVAIEEQKCADRQVKVGGECLPIVSLGRACVHSAQCTGMGECLEGVCDCPQELVRKGERCERRPKPPPQPVSPVVVGPVRQIQPALPVKNRPETALAYTTGTPQIVTTAMAVNEGLCPHPRAPFLVNGIARQCTQGQTCPVGYACTWSQQAKNYFCCTNNKMIARTNANLKDICLGSEPLIFPNTKAPVLCSRFSSCPQGFMCRRSSKTRQAFCCKKTEPVSMDIYIAQLKEYVKTRPEAATPNIMRHVAATAYMHPGRRVKPKAPAKKMAAPPKKSGVKPAKSKSKPCPGSLVLLEVEINKRVISRCQSGCPTAMKPVNGVCRVPRNKNL